jgi:hypothetical protein
VCIYLISFGRVPGSGNDVPPELDVLFDKLEADAAGTSSNEDSLGSHGMK